jgi:DME family drug/metabolite transporter
MSVFLRCYADGMAYWVVALAAVTWGTWPLFLRPAAAAPLPAAVTVMLLCALPTPFVFRPASLRDRGATVAMALFGLSNSLNLSCYFMAIDRGPVSVAIFSHYLAPVLVALTAPWVLKEPRSRRALVALPIILGGLLLVVGLPSGQSHGPTALIGALSAVGFACNVFATKVAVRAYSPVAVMSIACALTGAILLLVFGAEAVPHLTLESFGWLAAGTLLPGFGAGFAFTAAVKRIPAQASGALCYLEPVTAALIGTFFLNEPMGVVGYFGAAMVVAAGIWVAREPAAVAE